MRHLPARSHLAAACSIALAAAAACSGNTGASGRTSSVPATGGATTAAATTGGAVGASTGGTQATGGTTAALAPNTAPAVAWPSLDFINNPGGKDPNNKMIALSFDDGPDGAGSVQGQAGKTNTSTILDTLKANGLHATFFICGNLWAHTIATDPLATADIKRMVAEGHTIGNHTYEHLAFDSNSTGANDPNLIIGASLVPAALSVNDTILHDPAVLGAAFPPMTLFRAPRGIPFQDNMLDVATMAPATAGHGVHVGWGLDLLDWQCAGNNQGTDCVMSTLNEYLSRGASGVMLMHSVYKVSADSLPLVIAAIKKAGYQFVMVEDFVQAKYGASSADVMRANIAAKFSSQAISDAAVASTKVSKWYLNTVE